jgi:salicylate hydroxylase
MLILADWNESVHLTSLLSEFSSFHPSILAVMKKAENVKKWPLLYREPISQWYKSKLVLIGDAVHPMLPHQGQAGAQAIEDAVALGIMLKGLTKSGLMHDPELLEKRLGLFQRVRSRRAASIQIFSNAAQDQASKVRDAVRPYVDGEIPSSPEELTAYNFGYDVREHCERVLRESSGSLAASL